MIKLAINNTFKVANSGLCKCRYINTLSEYLNLFNLFDFDSNLKANFNTLVTANVSSSSVTLLVPSVTRTRSESSSREWLCV